MRRISQCVARNPKMPMTGQTISHYKILEKIGEGGMGVVYKAQDTKLDRLVVLKFLPAQIRQDPEVKSRFVHEAKAAATLNHPNICTIYEIDEYDGQPFIAMEFIEGQSLQDIVGASLVGAQPKAGTRPAPTLDEILNYATQIAEGLQAAHEKGVIHRDIKPANIMVTTKGQVKIMDFGLAKLAGQTKLTQTGTTLGTLAYMSPEQLLGSAVDAGADLWAFGAVLYETVTGQLPFAEEYQEAMLYSILNEAPPAPSDIRDDLASELERLILRCLCKDRTDRYPSASALLLDLRSLHESLVPGKVDSETSALERKPPKKRESERRQTTVLCASLFGYSELLDTMDPEDVAAALESCFNEIEKVALKYQGTVDKIARNCVTVLFGLPQAIEAAPQKAVSSALAMRARVRELSKEQKMRVSLDLQIGIDSGIIIVGAAGESRSFTLIGEPVERASLIAEAAPSAGIIVGPLTHRFTCRDFEFKNLAPLRFEGKKKPVAVFELLSTEEQLACSPLHAERMIHSDMVGRDKELDKLRLHVLKVINGEGSIVNLIGEAGIGKSRLIAELRQLEDMKKVALLEGRALSIGRNLSYHPLIDIIKDWAAITEKDGDVQSQVKLEKAIRDVHPEGVDEVFPFIATLMGMKLSGKHAERVKGIEGAAMEKLILKNLRELMMKGAERRPIVYILQDLHWADQTSIELLESLYRLAQTHPICFVNVLRPDYPETSERLLTTVKERYPKIHTELVLEPLDETQCDALIGNLLKASGIPNDLRTTIAQKAEGNPFFIEEVVRSFIDEGALVLQNGKFKVTEKIDSVLVPETIQDVLLTRIDRLDEETKSLLKHASVVGRYFFYKILAEVAKPTEDIGERLDYLQEVQLVLESKRVEELEYLFKHALSQEVTYESILIKKRKELHLQVAEAIESLFSERLHEFYGMLALHYSKGENLEKAEEYLIKAGEEALKAAASSEALEYYQEAVKLYLDKMGDNADSEKLAMLEKNIALAFYNKGRMAESVEHFDKVLRYWGEARPGNKVAALISLVLTLLNLIVRLYLPKRPNRVTITERENEIISLIEKRGRALVTVDTERMFIDSIGLLGKINRLGINNVENGPGFGAGSAVLFSLTGISLRLADKILNHASSSLDNSALKRTSSFYSYEAVHDFISGNWNTKSRYDEKLVDDCLAIGEVFGAGAYAIWSGFKCIEKGNFHEAAKVVDKLAEMADLYEHDLSTGRKFVLHSKLLLKRRDLHTALKEAEAGSSFIRKLDQHLYALWVLGSKPYVQVLLKDFKGANETLAVGYQILGREKRNLPAYLSGFLMSQFLLDLCYLEESIMRGEKAKFSVLRKTAHQSGKAAIENALKFAPDRTEVFKLMGVYYWVINKQRKSLKWWDKSIRTGEQLGGRPELARTYFEVGKRLLEPKSKCREWNGLTADEYLDKAQAMFKAMELEWDLEQLGNVRQDALRISEARST